MTNRSHTACLKDSSGGFRKDQRCTADREPTCNTGEAGHYSRSLASKAGNHSRHLLLVRKTPTADQDADQGVAQKVDQETGGWCSGGRIDAKSPLYQDARECWGL